MTITSTQNRVSYAGNGAPGVPGTLVFAVPFRFLATSDLVVLVRVDATGADTTMTLDTNYSVAGEGAATGGTVTFLIEDGEPQTGETLIVYGNPAMTQLVDYISGGTFPAESHEEALDRLTLQSTRTREIAERALPLTESSTDGSGQYNANSNRISSLGTPTATTDATTKTYVDVLVNNTALGPAPTGLIATGSVTSRLLSDRWGEVKNVKDFGAVGNGVANDTAVIQAAFAAGGVWHFPAGTYLCPTWTTVVATGAIRITSDSNAVIKGDGSDVFIRPAGGDVSILGLTFDLWQSVLSNAAADTGTTGSMEVIGCSFVNISGGCINHERPINRCLISGNQFIEVSNYAIRIGRSVYADQDNWKDISVVHNTARGIDATGATNAAFAVIYGRYSNIAHNFVEDVDADSGEAWGVYTKCRWSTITGNVVRDVASVSGPVYYINIKGSSRQQTVSPQGFAVTCSANAIHGTGTGVGIRIQNDEVCVTGNVVDSCNVGINTSSGYAYRNWTIADNTIFCPSVASGVYGINIVGEASGVTCTGNAIAGGENGIRMAATGSAVVGWIVDRNVIRGCTTGIYSNSAAYIDDISISGNVILGFTSYGFLIGEMKRVRIHDNTIEETGIAAMSTQGADELLDLSLRHTSTFQTSSATLRGIIFFDMADNTALHCKVTATAMESDGSDRALYGIGGLFYRDGGATTQQGADYNVFSAIESDATWGGLSLTPSTNALSVAAQGVAAQTVNWTVTLDISSVS